MFSFSEAMASFNVSDIYFDARSTRASLSKLTATNSSFYSVIVVNGGGNGFVTIGFDDAGVTDVATNYMSAVNTSIIEFGKEAHVPIRFTTESSN